MTMSTEELLQLIHEYRAAVDHAARVLIQVTGCAEPLFAVRSARVPRQGVLPGGTYRFHGVGCEVVLGDVTVDFDWGPDGRYGGFDAWRLSHFSEHRGHPVDDKVIAAKLIELEKAGTIDAPRLEPSTHLYYVRTAN
jgi:hypothetical protein